jgi:hypothetical protein
MYKLSWVHSEAHTNIKQCGQPKVHFQSWLSAYFKADIQRIPEADPSVIDDEVDPLAKRALLFSTN